ncbi:polysaccharide biosynthesis/export family protein [Candidatus Neomarinimicrobiota bacterium]
MKKIITIILLFTYIYAQNVENIFSDKTVPTEKPSELSRDMVVTNEETITYTPVEKAIDSDTYILGPGDLLGINILTVTNISLQIRINPAGDIMIPSVGVLNVSGISLSDAKIKISDFVIKNALKNAVISVTLADIRRFKIQVLGAVDNPGYFEMTPIDKTYDAIIKSGGVQKYAHPEIVKIIRDGQIVEVKLKEYLSGQDLSQNMSLKEGDIVYVPFSDYAIAHGLSIGDYNNHQIVIYGYVNRNNSRGNTFVYYPGYTVRDYIAMAGGTKEVGSIFRMGNTKRVTIYRSDGSKIKNAFNEIVLPGDMIEVPPSSLYQIVGRDGVIRTIASIISSTYLIYRFTRD